MSGTYLVCIYGISPEDDFRALWAALDIAELLRHPPPDTPTRPSSLVEEPVSAAQLASLLWKANHPLAAGEEAMLVPGVLPILRRFPPFARDGILLAALAALHGARLRSSYRSDTYSLDDPADLPF